MAVGEWYPAFLKVHLARMARKDLSEAAGEFWKLLKQELVRSGIGKEAANHASKEIAIEQPEHVSQHHKRFLELAKRYQAELHVGNPVEDRATAMAQALNCEWCSGNGLALVERADGEPFEVATAAGMEYETYTLVTLCKCSMASWLRPRNKFKFTELGDLIGRYVPVIPANTYGLDEIEVYEPMQRLIEATQ
jgi:hypothetical protein